MSAKLKPQPSIKAITDYYKNALLDMNKKSKASYTQLKFKSKKPYTNPPSITPKESSKLFQDRLIKNIRNKNIKLNPSLLMTDKKPVKSTRQKLEEARKLALKQNIDRVEEKKQLLKTMKDTLSLSDKPKKINLGDLISQEQEQKRQREKEEELKKMKTKDILNLAENKALNLIDDVLNSNQDIEVNDTVLEKTQKELTDIIFSDMKEEKEQLIQSEKLAEEAIKKEPEFQFLDPVEQEEKKEELQQMIKSELEKEAENKAEMVPEMVPQMVPEMVPQIVPEMVPEMLTEAVVQTMPEVSKLPQEKKEEIKEEILKPVKEEDLEGLEKLFSEEEANVSTKDLCKELKDRGYYINYDKANGRYKFRFKETGQKPVSKGTSKKMENTKENEALACLELSEKEGLKLGKGRKRKGGFLKELLAPFLVSSLVQSKTGKSVGELFGKEGEEKLNQALGKGRKRMKKGGFLPFLAPFIAPVLVNLATKKLLGSGRRKRPILHAGSFGDFKNILSNIIGAPFL